jgi:hypothetical protein
LINETKISEMITNQAPWPLTNINFPVTSGVVAPTSITLQP